MRKNYVYKLADVRYKSKAKEEDGMVAMRTTYGQRGGAGPNTGKKAATFACVAPDGTELRRRFFGTAAQPIPAEAEVVAALLPPSNGYGWHLWAVAPCADAMPSYVLASWDAHENGRGVGPDPITVHARRV